MGRWVALNKSQQIIGHVGVTRVVDDEKAVVWKKALDYPLSRLAEIGRLLIHPDYRKAGVSTQLTRACLRGIIERGMIPVATSLASATASLSMMTSLGWRVVGSVTGGPSNLELNMLIAPQKLTDAALSKPFTPPMQGVDSN